MAKLGALTVFLNSDTKNFRRGMSGAQRTMGQLKVAGIAAGAAVSAAMIKLGKDSVQAFGVQRRAEAKLESSLKSMQGAVGLSIFELKKYASEIQDATAIGDESIIDSMGQLATFGNIAGDEFKRTTMAAVDMAAKMGTDTKSAVIQLGRALNDPAIGLTLLNRTGVTFSETQKDMIKEMVKANDLLGAQDMILSEVERQFTGTAKALADATPWQHAISALGDMKEAIGAVIVDLFSFDDQAMTISDRIKEMTAWIKRNTPGITLFLKEMWIEIKFGFKQAWTFAKNFVDGITVPLQNIVTVATWLGDNFGSIWKDIGRVALNVFQKIGENIVNKFKSVWEFISNPSADAFKAAAKAFSPKTLVTDIIDGIAEGADLVAPELAKVTDVYAKTMDDIYKIDEERRKALLDVELASMKKISDESMENFRKVKAAAGAAGKAAKKSAGAVGKTTPTAITAKFSAFIEKGTVDAFSAITRAGATVQDKILTENQKQTKLQQQMVMNQPVTVGIT